MKLRIRGDSIRLRLTQSEVQALRGGEQVEERTHFGDGVLVYSVRGDATVAHPAATFAGGCVAVVLPRSTVDAWADSDDLSIDAEQSAGERRLRILVEKDLQCLAPREGEDDSDAFPNPGCASA